MTGNYKNVGNVDYAKYLNDSEKDAEPDIEGSARVDELYIDAHGSTTVLHLGLEAPDGFESIRIPIMRSDEWREFAIDVVETLR